MKKSVRIALAAFIVLGLTAGPAAAAAPSDTAGSTAGIICMFFPRRCS